MSENVNNSITSDHLVPETIITRRTRSNSTTKRAFDSPECTGTVKSFCRQQGHGFITPDHQPEAIFVHISDIEGEYVPLPGDQVKYRLCPIPPKFESYQAVHVVIINYVPEKHLKWNNSP